MITFIDGDEGNLTWVRWRSIAWEEEAPIRPRPNVRTEAVSQTEQIDNLQDRDRTADLDDVFRTEFFRLDIWAALHRGYHPA